MVDRVPVSFAEMLRMIVSDSGGKGNAASKSSLLDSFTHGIRFW